MGLNSVSFETGNEATHHSDIQADMHLFDKMHMIPNDELVFQYIYGFRLPEAATYHSMFTTSQCCCF